MYFILDVPFLRLQYNVLGQLGLSEKAAHPLTRLLEHLQIASPVEEFNFGLCYFLSEL